MHNLLYLSAALAAVAFFILVIYVARTLKALQATLETLTKTTETLNVEVQKLSTESTELVKNTNVIAVDVQHKLEQVNKVVESVTNVANTVNDVNDTLKKYSAGISAKLEGTEEKTAQMIKIGSIAAGIWKGVRKTKGE